MQHTLPRLGARFREALAVAGVGASGVLIGCGGDVREPALELGYRETDSPSGSVTRAPGFVPLSCVGEGSPRPVFLGGLEPREAVDYLELRLFQELREARGTACSTAGEPARCRAELEGLPFSPALRLGYLVQVVTEYHLRATRGDNVLRVGTLAELLEFLGPLDTLAEAELVVASQNYELICGASGGVPEGDGFDVLAFTYQGCDGRTRHLVHASADGALEERDVFVERTADPYCVVGRRPRGLVQRGSGGRAGLGGFFAGCAELEAASVYAFLTLAEELALHSAPSGLVLRALQAARDEVGHAQSAARLSRRWGGCPRLPKVLRRHTRSLEQSAIENAMEGCVRETYGALTAVHQARRSTEHAVRRAYATIARDETRHAALAWDVARWAERRLSAPARGRVADARRGAAEELQRELRGAQPLPVDAAAGLPSPLVGGALAEHLMQTLWRS
jgi:hypothetical protein